MIDETKRRGRTTSTAALLLMTTMFVVVALVPSSFAQVPPCGDGFLDGGEECDEGAETGTPASCCAIDCTFRSLNTPCRDTTGECDPADVCSGTSGTCDDAKRTDVCRPAAGPCDVAESCDGSASDCPADAFEAASLECRPGAGVCDLAESCTGNDADCPADAKSTAECRAGAGVCDVAESCDGVGDDCPANAFEPASVECRGSAGVCDVAEHCSGSAAACPADGLAPTSVECRGSAGVCDVAEHCSGSAAACPADGFASASLVCRPDAGACDVAETCTGGSADCPANGFEPDETSCNDGNSCSTNDRCIGGACGGFLESCGNGTTEHGCAEECDDGNVISDDGCTDTCQLEPCGPEPIAGCRPTTVAGKAAVQIIARLNPDKNRLQWKYTPGGTTPLADFGNPTDDTSYQFCIYQEIGGDPQLAARYAVPAGGMCGVKPCWVQTGNGFKYSNKEHTPEGISAITLKQGLAPGKTKILVQGRGANLPIPPLPLIQSPNVVMQLRASNGVCWETTYGAPAFRNLPDQFRDK